MEGSSRAHVLFSLKAIDGSAYPQGGAEVASVASSVTHSVSALEDSSLASASFGGSSNSLLDGEPVECHSQVSPIRIPRSRQMRISGSKVRRRRVLIGLAAIGVCFGVSLLVVWKFVLPGRPASSEEVVRVKAAPSGKDSEQQTQSSKRTRHTSVVSRDVLPSRDVPQLSGPAFTPGTTPKEMSAVGDRQDSPPLKVQRAIHSRPVAVVESQSNVVPSRFANSSQPQFQSQVDQTPYVSSGPSYR